MTKFVPTGRFSLTALITVLLSLNVMGCGDGSGSAAPPSSGSSTSSSSTGGSASSSGGTANDYTTFANETRVTVSGYSGDEMEPFISKDGKFLFFNNRNDPAVDTNIFYATRVDDQTFTGQGQVQGVNSTSLDGVPSLDSAGNFYFVSTRSYSTTLSTIYSGAFVAGSVASVATAQGISRLQQGVVNFDAEISGDGNTLWFDDGQYSASAVLQAASIVIADKNGAGFARRSNSAALLANVNTSGLNYAPSISVDGLELFFTRVDSTTSGKAPAIFRATRADTQSVFGAPQHVTGATGFVEAPSLTADGRTLYYHKLVNGVYQIYKLQR